ncbi:uncharacterized protein VICG_01764 [Vittaforma corneae ATCC 50505]|uniref:Protein kinase domain-containing protein n=1 Tax=Vittaforma corneae (strain ATCC 50505) TaxID=993615 RepID=L2GL07_VITCO|nr:uncharacterized protein VICG_01764 [Vittaforma corneae ATCC 50505]ELA41165.1 hypothetical protein VICG_01764 [Vittaforma corneae ATCC 50505]
MNNKYHPTIYQYAIVKNSKSRMMRRQRERTAWNRKRNMIIGACLLTLACLSMVILFPVLDISNFRFSYMPQEVSTETPRQHVDTSMPTTVDHALISPVNTCSSDSFTGHQLNSYHTANDLSEPPSHELIEFQGATKTGGIGEQCPNPNYIASNRAVDVPATEERNYPVGFYTNGEDVYSKALEEYYKSRSLNAFLSSMSPNLAFQSLDSHQRLFMESLKRLFEDLDHLNTVASGDILTLKLQRITSFFDTIDIKNMKDREHVLDFLNSEYGLKDLEIENIHEFSVFKVAYDGALYVLKQIGCSKGYEKFHSNDLLAKDIDSPNVAKILHVFERSTSPKPGEAEDKDIWYLSEYLDISLDSNYVKQNGVAMIRKIARDVLMGLKALHEKNIAYNNSISDSIRGALEIKEDGNWDITFKLINLGREPELVKYQDPVGRFFGWSCCNSDFEQFGHMLHKLSNKIGQSTTTTKPIKVELRAPGQLFFSQFMGFLTRDEKLIDLILVCKGYTKYPPQSIDDVLSHQFFTGEELCLDYDRFGRRYYLI